LFLGDGSFLFDRVMALPITKFFGRREMTKGFLVCVVLGGALLAVSSLQGHHSLAGTYDLKKTVRGTGPVQKIAFTNPHGALTIEIKDEKGVAKNWVLTTGSSNVLTNAGISATGPGRLKPGDVITVSFNPAMNGNPLGFLRSMALPNKSEVQFVVE
jgi:hypothetical protein